MEPPSSDDVGGKSGEGSLAGSKSKLETATPQQLLALIKKQQVALKKSQARVEELTAELEDAKQSSSSAAPVTDHPSTGRTDITGADHAALARDLEEAQARAREYRESAENAEKQLSDAKAELTQCLSVNEELRRKAEDAERAVASAAADAEEKERLCAQLEAARSAIDEVNEKLRDTTAENDNLRKQLEDLVESQRSHNEERARLEDDLAAALDRESDLAARAEELGRRADDAGESMHNVVATEALKAELHDVREQLADAKAAAADAERLRDELAAAVARGGDGEDDEEIRRLQARVAELEGCEKEVGELREMLREQGEAGPADANAEELERLRSQVAKLSIGMENLQAAETCVEELTRKLGDTEHQYLAQLANVQEEKDVMREQINALTEQVALGQGLAADLDEARLRVLELERALAAEQEAHKEAANAAGSKDLLSMELVDYQRSVASLEKMVESKTQEIVAKDTAIAELEEKAATAKKLEENLKKVKQLLMLARKDLAEAKSQVDEKDAQYQQVKTENEQRAAAVDQLRHDLAAAQATCAELQQQLKDAGQASSQQMKERSLRIDNLERELQSANAQLENVKDEYQKYKARAQSVLKKREHEKGGDGHDAVARQPTMLTSLTMQLENTRAQLLERTKELESLSDAYSRLEGRLQALNDENSQLAHSLEVSHAQAAELARARADLDATKAELARVLQRQEAQQSSLTESLESRVDEAKRKALDMLAEQRRECDNLRVELERAKAHLQTARHANADLEEQLQEQTQLNQKLRAHQDMEKTRLRQISISRLEDQSEHSQTADPSVPRAQSRKNSATGGTAFVDLNRLLSMAAEMNETNDFAHPPPNRAPSQSSYTGPFTAGTAAHDMDRVGELLAAQKQINHLRELVRDNESHVTRLESQVDVLKEEIRRLERNQKRYDGINLEYLKNIMVSFLDAENEKDRAPLLQVFAQMLQFSPEELAKLSKAHAAYETRLANKTTSSAWGSGWFGT